MRMWMIQPELLCNKHLLGEHGEIHKHRYNFIKKHSIQGRIIPTVQIEPLSMQTRHDDLAAEMTSRKMNHKSPYQQPDITYLNKATQKAKVNIQLSKVTLAGRCVECKRRIYG